MNTLETDAPVWRHRARLGGDLAHHIGPMTNTVARDLAKGRGTLNARFFASYWRGRFAAVGKRPAL